MNQTSGIQTSSNQQAVSQVPPGQFQPAFVQAPPGQRQPVQYYAQPGQQVQPVQAGQQVQPAVQAGQQAQQAQPVLSGQPQNQDRPGAITPITTAYWKSALDAERLVEFLVLLAAWISIVKYSNDVLKSDGKVNFFKGITVFCWVMVIIFQIAFVFGFNKTKRYFSQPSHFTIICFVVQIILTILLIACTANLVPLANDNTKWYDFLNERGKTTLVTLYLALIFGFLACICFLEDVRLFFKMIGTQRAEEHADNTEQIAQQPLGTDQQRQGGVVTQPIPAQPAFDSQM